MSGLRDYGLGPANVLNAPKLVKLCNPPDIPEGCPNCGCETIAFIEVKVQHEKIRGGTGTGNYYSCVACPWASPMIAISDASKMEADDKATKN